MQTLTEKDYKKILVCLTLYITSLFAANTIGIKIMPFLFGTHLSVAVFSFPIVFLMTDVIGEVYGKKMAKNFVLAGVISILLFIFYTIISFYLPWSPQGLWAKGGYDVFFGINGIAIRMSVASLLAFVIAEYQDVLSFFFFKKNIGAKHFWIRSNLSNAWSQLLDSAIFTFVAFLGTGKYTIHTMIMIVIAWWIYKVFMGFLFTPLSYLGIYILKGKNNGNQSNHN